MAEKSQRELRISVKFVAEPKIVNIVVVFNRTECGEMEIAKNLLFPSRELLALPAFRNTAPRTRVDESSNSLRAHESR